MRNRRANGLSVCSAALMLGFAPVPTNSQSQSQDWPRYGHDAALTGRSSLKGDITAPRVAWSCPLAGRELLLELTPAQGEHRLRIAVDAPVSGPQTIQPPEPQRLDLDGTGTLRPLIESNHERWAKVLPAVPGLQRVAWDHTWTDQQVCRLQLFAYDQGFDKPRLVWQTDPPEAVIFNPLNIVYDIDHDGVQEVLVAAHYRVMIFEGTTGRKETELRYHSSRPYGWFGLANLDNDKPLELITIGDFQSHIDVLDFDPAKPEPQRLSVKWRRDIEQNIDRREKWPQIGPYPVTDVTGDLRPEIVVNLFNDTGDEQWHAVVLDADTGQPICDLPQRFVQGVADANADGAADLFLASTSGVLVHTLGTIELVSLGDRKPVVLWAQQDAGWCAADLPRLGPTWSTTASQGMRHVLLTEDKRPAFLVQSGGWHGQAATRVACVGPDLSGLTRALTAVKLGRDAKPERLWEVQGLIGETEPVALTDVGALMRVKLAPNAASELVGDNVQARVVQSQPLGLRVSMPIAARLQPDGPMIVVAEGPGESIFAIAAPDAGHDQPRVLWQRPGRGMADGSRALGLLAADLDADGGCEIIAADHAPAGHAALIAYRHDGTAIWHKPFEVIPGASPIWNTGALTLWWPGHFRRPDRLDLFVNTRRGLMHSDIGQLLDGRDLTTIWTQRKAAFADQFSWGYAGTPLAVADVNGDQRDELVCLHPVCFWIANGRDGQLTAGKDLASRKELPAWAAYGQPIVHDFNADGQPEVLLDSPYVLALLDTTGKTIWHGLGRADYPVKPGEGNLGQTTPCKHALADLDADGTFEIASAGYGDGARAIDPRDGKRLWSLAAPEPTGPKATAANIDGAGGDELIYPAGDTLVVITGDRAAARVLWTWKGPAALSLPAIADVDADGQAEIIVQDANATVHCLDGKAPGTRS